MSASDPGRHTGSSKRRSAGRALPDDAPSVGPVRHQEASCDPPQSPSSTAISTPQDAPQTPAPLSVVSLPVDALEPNPWNPNRMGDETREKLRAYLAREGLLQPLVVRPLPGVPDRYQILGGFHRWQICKDRLGYTEVPCVVVDLDDRRSKILTVNLNELAGDPVPHLLADLIHDLTRDTTLDDLATQLPYGMRELEDALELLKLPEGLTLQLEEDVATHADGTPTAMTFVVDEPGPVSDAIDRVASTLEGRNRRGRALTAICRAFLAAAPAPTPATEPAQP